MTTRIDGDYFEDTEWDEAARECRARDKPPRNRCTLLGPARCDGRGVGAVRGREGVSGEGEEAGTGSGARFFLMTKSCVRKDR